MRVWIAHAAGELDLRDACHLCLFPSTDPASWHARAILAPLSAAGLNKMSWRAPPYSKVSLVVFTTLTRPHPSLFNKCHYITGPNSVHELQNTAHGQHILPPFTSTWLCTCPSSTSTLLRARLCLLSTWMCIMLVIMTGGNSCSRSI